MAHYLLIDNDQWLPNRSDFQCKELNDDGKHAGNAPLHLVNAEL